MGIFIVSRPGDSVNKWARRRDKRPPAPDLTDAGKWRTMYAGRGLPTGWLPPKRLGNYSPSRHAGCCCVAVFLSSALTPNRICAEHQTGDCQERIEKLNIAHMHHPPLLYAIAEEPPRRPTCLRGYCIRNSLLWQDIRPPAPDLTGAGKWRTM